MRDMLHDKEIKGKRGRTVGSKDKKKAVSGQLIFTYTVE
jgi:hypothetical protein